MRNRCISLPWSVTSGGQARWPCCLSHTESPRMIQPESWISSRSVRPAPPPTTVAVVANGRYIRSRKARSSPSHQVQPPSSRSPTIRPLPAIAPRAPIKRRRVGVSPGGSTPSRTAAPAMVTIPAKRNRPIAPSRAPSQRSSGRRRLGTAATGTTAEPLPIGPRTATVTLFEPGAMIQAGWHTSPRRPPPGGPRPAGACPRWHCTGSPWP
jgi:hypothetical protein